MLKLIFKNLWARRRRNIWVVVEMVLITVVAWVVLDPAIVTGYHLSLDPGYDIDRLVAINLAEIPKGGKGYDEDAEGKMMENVYRILDKVRTDSRVEAATIAPNLRPEGAASVLNSFPVDTVSGYYLDVKFFRGTDYFKTFGIKGLDGKPFQEPPLSGSEIIVSRSVAQIMHPGINAVGHYFNETTDTTFEKYSWNRDRLIAGVTDEIAYRSTISRSPVVFQYDDEYNANIYRSANAVILVLRIKPGINPHRFIEEYSPIIASELKAGNVYAHSPQLYTQLRDNMAMDSHNKYVISLALAVFFFVNLCLGIIGTFYLQTRTRSRDTGIMRSFGATPRKILMEIMSEGWLMTTISWILGCCIFYVYARKNGLARPVGAWYSDTDAVLSVLPLWFDSFWTHFFVVSLIIYAILMLTVSIGIYIPARSISKANPVDALKDE